MEELRLLHMIKSAKGSIEQPGENVAQKRRLNRQFADQGLRQLRTFIQYKLAWSGGTFEAVKSQAHKPKVQSMQAHGTRKPRVASRVQVRSLWLFRACRHERGKKHSRYDSGGKYRGESATEATANKSGL